MTLRTVWNWAKHSKLVHGDFPTRGLKYPKGDEKPPYMPFQDLLRRTKRMNDDEAAELWECAFLTREEIAALLAYVKGVARHSFTYPMFVFCGHTGARRSEMARTQVSDLDFRDGFVTLRERKKSRETKTTTTSAHVRIVQTSYARLDQGTHRPKNRRRSTSATSSFTTGLSCQYVARDHASQLVIWVTTSLLEKTYDFPFWPTGVEVSG